MATHLIDTSVAKRLHNPSVALALSPLLGEVARTNYTDLEVGYSARNVQEWDLVVSRSLATFDRIQTTADHVERALEVQRMLAERSQRGRKVADLLIAAAAEAAGLVLLHYDADFDLIAAVTGQHTEWVVPRGSVD